MLSLVEISEIVFIFGKLYNFATFNNIGDLCFLEQKNYIVLFLSDFD